MGLECQKKNKDLWSSCLQASLHRTQLFGYCRRLEVLQIKECHVALQWHCIFYCSMPMPFCKRFSVMFIILLCCKHKLPAAGIHTTNGLGQSLNCSTAPSGGLELEQGSVTFLWENLMCLYCQLSNLYYGLYFKDNFILFPCLHFPMLEQNLQVELVSVGF